MAVAIVDMSVEMTFGSMAGRTMWAGEGLGVVLEVVIIRCHGRKGFGT